MAVHWATTSDVHLPVGSLVMLAGVPGSGKSTLSARCAPDVRLLEADRYRGAVQVERGLPEHAYHPECVPEARTRFLADLHTHLSAGDSTIVEAALLSDRSRQELIDLGAEYGRPVHLVLVHATWEQCLEGVQCRSRSVPVERLKEFWALWENLEARLRADDALPGVSEIHIIDRAAARTATVAFR